MISEEEFVPYHSVDLTGVKALLLAPHPDDETIGCGGSLLLHRENNDPVKVVILTDGRMGDVSARCSEKEYIALRREEARSAADILGVNDLEFWNIQDRKLAESSEALSRLVTLLKEYCPNLIYVPSPVEIHPDHRAAAYIAWEAVKQVDVDMRVAFYETNQPLKVNALVDISKVVSRKAVACDAYTSQLAERPYKDTILGLNRFRALTLPPSATHAEGFYICSSEEIRKSQPHSFWLRQFAVAPAENLTIGPRVSVIIRTRNRPGLLREALLSVLDQTYRNSQIIVVNDGGKDVRGEIDDFASLADINYLVHNESRGRAAAANAGLKAATGKYINLLDDDDIFYPNHLEVLVNFLEQTQAGAAYTDCELGHYVWKTTQYVQEKLEPFSAIDFDRGRLLHENFIPSMTIMIRSELCEEIGPFDESLDVYEDWDYWIRLARTCSIKHLPEITAQYRQFEGRTIGKGGRGYDFIHWTNRVLRKYQQDWPPDARALAGYLCRTLEDLGNEKSSITAVKDHEINRLAGIIGERDQEIDRLAVIIADAEKRLKEIEETADKTTSDLDRQVLRNIQLCEKNKNIEMENRQLSDELNGYNISRVHRAARRYVNFRKKLKAFYYHHAS